MGPIYHPDQMKKLVRRESFETFEVLYIDVRGHQI